MLPSNSLSSELVRAPFQYPYNLTRRSLLEDYELGGIALSDPSQGQRVQGWYGRVDAASGDVTLKGLDTGEETTVYNQSNVFEFSFCFDQNMRWVAVFTLMDGSTLLRWYDPTVAAYITTVLAGLSSARLTLDDSRELQIQSGATDVILTYLKPGTGEICFRAQRDRYLVEYPLADDLPPNLIITNFGMSRVNRIQWRLRARTFNEVIPWLP